MNKALPKHNIIYIIDLTCLCSTGRLKTINIAI